MLCSNHLTDVDAAPVMYSEMTAILYNDSVFGKLLPRQKVIVGKGSLHKQFDSLGERSVFGSSLYSCVLPVHQALPDACVWIHLKLSC